VGTGWSRSHKRAIADWYLGQSPAKLAMLVTKYQNREGWSHRDVLRLAHVKPTSQEHDLVLRFAARGFGSLAEVPVFAEALAAPHVGSVPVEDTPDASRCEDEEAPQCSDELGKVAEYLAAVERCKSVEDVGELVHLIQTHGLMREHVPTGMLGDVAVWAALLKHMPMTAMIRNLGKMTSIGLLADGAHESTVVSALRNEAKLHRARIHPFSVLLAWYTYRNGQGDKGSLRWDPLPAVLDALEYAFYASFKNVKPTGQRILLALDVSGSMCARILNTPLSAFQDDFVDLDITAGDRLEHVLQATSDLPFGGTDCSLPMLWAIENNAAVDCFIVITDNETYAGAMHPHVALQRYRQLMGIEAKMIVVGMTATEFTIADPEDAGMLDMVGFDASAPEIMRQFLVGDL
jgi:60 kDa SS-A/Ro ribonucleoprotein